MSWASERQRAAPANAPALAAILSLHLAVLAAVSMHSHYRAAAPGGAPAAPRVLTVTLLPGTSRAPLAPHAAAQPPRAMAAAPRDVSAPALQPPLIASGLTPGGALLLPGIAAGDLSAHFWIDARGAVERVELGAHRYSEEEAQRLLEALLQVRFFPARRHGMAVPAEVTLDLMVASSLGA